MNAPRIEPVTEPYSPEVAARFAALLPPGMTPPAIFRVVAKNAGLFSWLVDSGLLGSRGLLDRRALSDRLRELVILRTCTATGNQYEFDLHARTVAKRMGLSALEVEHLRAASLPETGWSDAERALVGFVDQVVSRQALGDETWAKVRASYSEETLLEVTLLSGLYVAIAMLVQLSRPRD